MARELQCSEFGITDCDFVARGETSRDVVRGFVEHFWREHNIAIRDADVVLDEAISEAPVLDSDFGKDVLLVITRPRETLDVDPTHGPTRKRPTLGETLPR